MFNDYQKFLDNFQCIMLENNTDELKELLQWFADYDILFFTDMSQVQENTELDQEEKEYILSRFNLGFTKVWILNGIPWEH